MTRRAGTPMPRLALRDPFAVRALVVVLVVATFFAAGDERMKRIAAAFDWQGVMMPANFRVDAWSARRPIPAVRRRSCLACGRASRYRLPPPSRCRRGAR